MSVETIIYIAIFILFSLFSGNAAKKKKEQQGGGGSGGGSLEDEIRRMAEKLRDRKHDQKAEPAPETKQYRTLADERNDRETEERQTDYTSYKPLERIPAEPVVDYSQQDIKKVEEQHHRFEKAGYDTTARSTEQKAYDERKKAKKIKVPVILPKEENTGEHIKHPLLENFDARNAIIYAEIFGKPRSETM